jgi:transcriptional regulator with XRE-family HTH domain
MLAKRVVTVGVHQAEHTSRGWRLREVLMPQHGPAVARRRLGAELRRLRDEAGLLIEQVADELECSTSKISRLENGKGIPKVRDVRDMLALYGVQDPGLHEELLRWVREGQQQGWWHDYADVLQPEAPVGSHLDTWVALETDASTLSTFQPNLVHGLVQTPDYARAVIEAVAYRHSPHEIERLVELRMRRQELLSRDSEPLQLRYILDEAVLWRPIGGRAAMCEQLRRLLREAERPNVTMQVVPFDIGAHQAVVNQFEILEFADAAAHEVVYVESLTGNAFLESDSDILRYRDAFDDVRSKALDESESAAFIETALVRHEQIQREKK